VEDLMNIHVLGKDLSLPNIARNAIKNKEVDVRLVDMGVTPIDDLRMPELDGQFIGHQFTPAGIVDETLAKRRAGIKRTKHIAAGTMEEAWNRAENLPLGALSRARSTKNQKGRELEIEWFRHECGEEPMERVGSPQAPIRTYSEALRTPRPG